MKAPDGPLFRGEPKRLPPSNIQAEQGLLGAILANNKAFDSVSAFLKTEHFADPINARIYESASRQINAGHAVDPITLKVEFENAGVLSEVGGVAYLTKLLTAMVSLNLAHDYGLAILDAWTRRAVIDVAEEALEGAFGVSLDTTAADVIADAVDGLLDLGERSNVWQVSDLGAAVDAAVAAVDATASGKGPRPLQTGIPTLDDFWGGLYPRSLDYLGARSQHGKTAIGVQILRTVAEQFLAEGGGQRAMFFSAEMKRDDIGLRMLSTETGISVDNLRRGQIQGERAERVIRGQQYLRTLPISIQDKSGMTLTDIESGARVGVKRRKVRFIVIDHVHRIKPSKALERLPRGDQVQAITAALKDLANDLDVPILLLCQLVKDVERREDPRPMIADLRFSIEQDADNIMLLWRPELHMPERMPPINTKLSEEKQAEAAAKYFQKRTFWRGKAEIIGAKRRAGESGRSAMLNFVGLTNTFSSIADPVQMDDRQEGFF